MNSGIYRFINLVNAKVYVGSAVDINKRKLKHMSDLKRGKHHCLPFQRAWLKYGETAFVFEVLERAAPEDLIRREQVHLDRVKDSEKYNICKRAYSHLGVKRSAETRAKLSASLRGRKCLPRTLEHQLKLTLAVTGRVKSPEERAKLSAAGKRRGIPRYVIDAAVVAHKGKPGHKHTEESKRAISQAHMGIRPNAAAVAKMRAAKLGRKLSEATRLKMSLTKRRWRNF